MQNPLLTVIMPVYNAEKYVEDAIESILNQTYRHFEFLIFNDCSTDRSRELILSFKDERIRLIDSLKNTGYVKHLNEGLKLAKGKYIARMDADDVSMPDRFQKQVTYLEAHPTVGVCGSWINFIGAKEDLLKFPVEHQSIDTQLFLFGNALAHPSVMLRKAVLDQYDLSYNAALEPAEDYDLWVRMADLSNLHNIPEVLLSYRVHEQNESVRKKSKQDAAVLLTRKKLIGETYPVWQFMQNQFPTSGIGIQELMTIRQYIKNIVKSNRYAHSWIKTELGNRWINWCSKASIPGYQKVWEYVRLPKSFFSIRICLSLMVHSKLM